MSIIRLFTHEHHANEHGKMDMPKVIENCRSSACMAKKSMLRVIADRNRKKRRYVFNDYGKRIPKEYYVRYDATAFYICKECAWMTKYNTYAWPDSRGIFRDLKSIFWIYLPHHDAGKMKALKDSERKRWPGCIECGMDEFPFPTYLMKKHEHGTSYIPTGKNELRPVLKLYLKKVRKYLGYYCHHCKVCYCIPLRQINWRRRIEEEGFKIYDLVRGEGVY